MEDERRGQLEPLSPGLLAASAIATVVLAAIVAAASRPGDFGPTAPNSSAETGAAVIRALVILFAIGEAGVLGLVVWALWSNRGRRRIGTREGRLALAIASFLQAAAALALFWLYLHYRYRLAGAGGGAFSVFGVVALPSIPDGRGAASGGPGWLTAAVVLAALAIAAAFALRSARFGRRPSARAKLAGQLQEAIEEGLEELEAEADPRRAVIAAYARMERGLARVGMPRARHEGALEYLERMLALLNAEGPLLRGEGSPVGRARRSLRAAYPPARLTELFQIAKFSDHPIDEGMKRDAIHSLVELRADLRARAAEEEGVPGVQPA